MSEAIRQIEETFDRDVLKREREVIVQLRDPNHLKATNIERALSTNAKLDDFLRVLRVPILIAYDSAVLGAGDQPDYVAHLVTEVTASYETIKVRLPGTLRDAQIHIFLIPVECAVSLATSFEALSMADSLSQDELRIVSSGKSKPASSRLDISMLCKNRRIQHPWRCWEIGQLRWPCGFRPITSSFFSR